MVSIEKNRKTSQKRIRARGTKGRKEGRAGKERRLHSTANSKAKEEGYQQKQLLVQHV
jgi:hypothetical protein